MIKKYQTTHEKEHKKQQHCPTCNRYIKYIEGQPAYICKKCIELATDKDGKAITFKTITESGTGIQGVYKESGKLYRSRTCYIKGVKCEIEETTFGITQNLSNAKKKSSTKSRTSKAKSAKSAS